MKKHNNEAAFPNEGLDDNEYNGMTLRDYFAGQALPGILRLARGPDSNELMAEAAYTIADAMLKERGKNNGI